jgi:hypothetical protein
MDNVHTAIALGVLAQRRIALLCRRGETAAAVRAVEACVLAPEALEAAAVDLSEGGAAALTPAAHVVFWQHVHRLDVALQEALVAELDAADGYDTTAARAERAAQPPQPPQPLAPMVVLVVEDGAPVAHRLKQKFWFCQRVPHAGHAVEVRTPLAQRVCGLRLRAVYVAPDIQRYIYLLVVHTRNHRLCLLAPMQTRLPTLLMALVRLLAETYVRWRASDAGALFVTPDVCKIAMRKVAYWLVDWLLRIAEALGEEDAAGEYAAMLRFSALGGDWFGSDWTYAKRYVAHSAARNRRNFNVVVEDALEKVQPPI